MKGERECLAPRRPGMRSGWVRDEITSGDGHDWQKEHEKNQKRFEDRKKCGLQC
jgi:hypothetical protein